MHTPRFFQHAPFLVILLLGAAVPRASAQVSPGSGWSRPLNLSESPASSVMPAIAAGPYGDVHVLWSEDLDGAPHPHGRPPLPGNAILYRRLMDGSWTDATDLFYGGAGSRLEQPSAVVDQYGSLHLAWIQDGRLSYSHAPATEAHRMRAWSTPVTLTEDRVGGVQLLSLGERLLAICTLTSAGAAGLYALPIDQDRPALPRLIWEDRGGLAPLDVSAAVDGRGRLHLSWSAGHKNSAAALEVRYARSEDGGETWTASRVVARQTSPDTSLLFAFPWVAARGEDEIHLQWAQGRYAYRWHQFSRDGGKRWSLPAQIWPRLFSQTYSRAIGVDGEDHLYWLEVLRYPNGAYLIPWTERRWATPELFYLIQTDAAEPVGERLRVHALRMAISLGNHIHAVFLDDDRAEIWYMQKVLDSHPTPPQDLPVMTGEAVLQPRVNSPAPALEPAATGQVLTPVSQSRPSRSPAAGRPVLIGVLPVAALVCMLCLSRLKRG